MFVRLAVAASAAAVVLNAASADAKSYKGVWKGVDWKHRMNDIPSGCKQGLPADECAVHSMWHKFGRSEYYALGSEDDDKTDGGAEGRKNWNDGSAFCGALGGEMISIGGELEMEFAISLLLNNRHGFWLGMERTDDLFTKNPEKFGFERWNDGAPVDWANWAPGEPNSQRYGTKDGDLVDTYVDKCAFQGMNQGDPSLWNDASCDKKRRVICERPLANPYPEETCLGVSDPADCESYYATPCHDVNNIPTLWFDQCAVKCNSCMTTSTTFATTTTTFATTTTSFATTTTSFATTTTSFATTTTSFATTTTSFATTTSTFATTTSTAEATTSTTGTTTTGVPSTTTTEAPITDAPADLGVCMQTPSKGWHSMNTDPNDLFKPVVDGGEPIHCCYKYVNKPRLSWDDAQATCEAVGTDYPLAGSTAGLATAYVPEINDKLVNVLLTNSAYSKCHGGGGQNGLETLEQNCRKKANGETTWLGGTTTDGTRVGWSNPFFAAYNDEDYGITGNDTIGDPYKFASDHNDNNGMFYDGEPSGLNMNRGRKGDAEECLAQGGSRKRVNAFGFAGWNDAKCSQKKGYFCEYCVRQSTTTTWAPTTTTTEEATTTTTQRDTTTTTQEPTTTTTEGDTTTTTQVDTTTTTQEPTTTTTQEPTTTTTAAPDCSAILCAGDCGDVWKKGMKDWGKVRVGYDACGWSKKYMACVPGGRTTDSEKFMGQCGTTTTTAKPASNIMNCASSYCSNTCGYGQLISPWASATAGNANNCAEMVGNVCIKSECGWSKKRDRCVVGGFTNPSEIVAKLGPKCRDPDPTREVVPTPVAKAADAVCLGLKGRTCKTTSGCTFDTAQKTCSKEV